MPWAKAGAAKSGSNENPIILKKIEMKKLPVALFIWVSVTALLLAACFKADTYDPNQVYYDQLKYVTDSIVQNTHVPGIVALVADHKRGIDWFYSTGLSDIPNKLPMDGGYTFRIGSITKTMVGTVVLQLVDERKLTLNDKLSKYFPAFPKSDSITITMLLNMTSGIFDYPDDAQFMNTLVSDPLKVWSPQEIVNVGFSHDFYFSPGTGIHYSSTGTFILGMIIEKVTGHSLQSEIENRIIKPLNLVNTGFITSGTELPGIHGRGYYMGPYVEGQDLTEHFDYSWAWAAGSVYTTPRELQKFVEMMVGGGFTSDSLQIKRLTRMQALTPKIDYGLGIWKRQSFYGHNGGVPGFVSSMYHSNEKNCTVIIYFNCYLDSPGSSADGLFLRYMKILYGGPNF